MSQFEFVSVALALVYAFAAARLLSALPWVLAPSRRYWIHAVWFGVIFLALVLTWWQVWALRDVAWNPVRFIWALAIPALIYLRAGVLVSQAPSMPTSWRNHYFETRVPFFAIGIAIAVNLALVPWVMGVTPWLTASPAHAGAAALLAIYLIGLGTERPAVHGALALMNGLLLIAFVIAATWVGDNSA